MKAGYAPWPNQILTFNKSKKSATVKYFGFDSYVGKLVVGEMVQLDETTRDEIGSLISFTLNTKCIREFARYEKAINEIQVWRSMD